jgi:hypothetical protein
VAKVQKQRRQRRQGDSGGGGEGEELAAVAHCLVTHLEGKLAASESRNNKLF